MLLDPVADGAMGFREEWLRWWNAKHYYNLNIYIFVDPANKKKKQSDYTCVWVLGYGGDGNWYVITVVRDKLNLAERTALVFKLHREYEPIYVFYEEYGMQTDKEHLEYVQEQENYRFDIEPTGGGPATDHRIL